MQGTPLLDLSDTFDLRAPIRCIRRIASNLLAVLQGLDLLHLESWLQTHHAQQIKITRPPPQSNTFEHLGCKNVVAAICKLFGHIVSLVS